MQPTFYSDMKYFGIAIIGAIATACAPEQPQGNLLIDLNGTTANTIYAYALPNITDVIDSATAKASVYHFDTSEWPYGFYRFTIDSINHIDIVTNGNAPINICARLNHLLEATTNDTETNLLWNVERLQAVADTITLPTDSLISVLRQQADHIRSHAANSIVMLPLLNLHVQQTNIYNIVADHNIFVAATPILHRIDSTNATAATLIAQTEEAKKMTDFAAKYQKTNELPQFSLSTASGYTVNNNNLAGTPFVLYYSTDTTSQGIQRWETISWARFSNQKVVACVPQKYLKTPKTNIFIGTFDAQTTQTFSCAESVAIYVDKQGVITKVDVRL